MDFLQNAMDRSATMQETMNSEEGVVPTQPSTSVKLEPTDKIIWGHPGLGKTTFRKQNSDKVLDFDTDFKPYIAKQLGLPVDEQNSIGLNKWRKENGDEEFNKLMRSVWTIAKNMAKKENKILIVSDMIFLRENAADFDKVITTDKDTFVKRAVQRGDNAENLESWKAKLDATISNIQQSKVITTDKYFSDLVSTLSSTNLPGPKTNTWDEYKALIKELIKVDKDAALEIGVLTEEEFLSLPEKEKKMAIWQIKNC
jgi:hypothetical protein